MKKFLSLALVLALSCSILAGCSSKNEQVDNVDTNNEVVDTGDTDNSGEVAAPEVTVGSANERLKYIINNAIQDEELIEAFPVETTNENLVLDFLGLSEDRVDEYAVTWSRMNVHAYMVAVMKPSVSNEEIVKDALQDYKESMIKSFEQYLVDQLEIAKNAEVFEHNGYIVLVMCADSTDVANRIKDGLDNIESIKIDETLNTVDEQTPEDLNNEDTLENQEVNQEDVSESDTNTSENMGENTENTAETTTETPSN